MSRARYFFTTIGLAVVQTLFFMSIIFLFERLDLIWLYVSFYNTDVFTAGELAMLFFLIMLANDLIAEGIRHLTPTKYLRDVVVISVVQFLILWGILDLLSWLNVITFSLITDWAIPPTVVFISYFFALILIAELLIEYILKPNEK